MQWIPPTLLAVPMIAQELYFNRHHILTAEVTYFVAPWIVILLMGVLPALFERLELDAGYLRYRYGFNTTDVPLAEVSLVRNYGVTTGQFVVEYNPSSPKADPKFIVVNPKDRRGFLSAMRQFAPQATFE
ncbi:MAG: hypothetical protein WBQ94_28625 [Terracidiphilus sp.]